MKDVEGHISNIINHSICKVNLAISLSNTEHHLIDRVRQVIDFPNILYRFYDNETSIRINVSNSRRH